MRIVLHKAQGHTHHGFQIKLYLFDVAACFTALEISPSLLLKRRSFEFPSCSRRSDKHCGDLVPAVGKGSSLPTSDQCCPFLQTPESQIHLPKDFTYFGHCMCINSRQKTCILCFHVHYLALSCTYESYLK